MTAHESPRLRADATRNRRAILDAADELLTQDGVENLTMDRVAAAAGVGKGTIFHRFGSRAGLIRELIFERARDLLEHVQSGPAPIGPGAPAAERLLAFFDPAVSAPSAMVRDLVTGSVGAGTQSFDTGVANGGPANAAVTGSSGAAAAGSAAAKPCQLASL
ncbi:TetR/AcrR family transcriptional regulator [Nocardia tengchongensis]|uniref:TetR/AcrR family transcriptional regulator n=1 Tax=Nocardia tengchongensis TaxID=2055889 RepID=UPI0036C30786